MTLVNLAQVLEPARRDGRGLAAFNVIQIEHAEAFAAAAEKVSLPVVMQISENCVRYHGSLAPIAETWTIRAPTAAAVLGPGRPATVRPRPWGRARRPPA